VTRIDARSLIAQVLDPETWMSWDETPVDPPGYPETLARARARSGYDEAVVTGEGRLDGRRVALIVSEFSFLGGSIGVATADRIVRAVERASDEELPLLAAPSSGGTRMQEGVIAFVQMARITSAVMTHRSFGLPYLVYLRNPTTGGVLASWGSLGHVTAAEPGALIGFLGPRVYEALYGEGFPPDVQTAENLALRGLVDAVVEPGSLRTVAAGVLSIIGDAETYESRPAGPPPEIKDTPAWDSVLRSREDDRPGVRELLEHATDVTMLSGTGEGENDPGLLLALARFGGRRCVLVGQDRRSQREGHPIGPAGLRVARRGMRLAAELGLALVTVVDTPGAVLSPEGENRGLAGEIARCLADLITLKTRTVCLLLGEGTGGAALALLPADRVICAEHAWLSPLPPEGASVIMHRDVTHAAEMAEAQGVRSTDLLRNGIVDRIIPESGALPAEAALAIAQELSGPEPDRTARADRFRPLGRLHGRDSVAVAFGLCLMAATSSRRR
jgi:acetyl-CoA carboxylase carboxyl transferase subunit beta